VQRISLHQGERSSSPPPSSAAAASAVRVPDTYIRWSKARMVWNIFSFSHCFWETHGTAHSSAWSVTSGGLTASFQIVFVGFSRWFDHGIICFRLAATGMLMKYYTNSPALFLRISLKKIHALDELDSSPAIVRPRRPLYPLKPYLQQKTMINKYLTYWFF